MNTKKRQDQLKKLEETVSKYNERINEKSKHEKIKSSKIAETKDSAAKTQIPVLKKTKLKEKALTNDQATEDNVLKTNKPMSINKSKIRLTGQLNAISRINLKEQAKAKMVKDSMNNIKESTMSLDSLDDRSQDTGRKKTCQSIGINTELLCPCVPCVIHDTVEQKNIIKKECKSNNRHTDQKNQLNPEVELLFKNPKMLTSSSDIMFSKNDPQLDCTQDSTFIQPSEISLYNEDGNNKNCLDKMHTNIEKLEVDHINSELFLAEPKSEYDNNIVDDIVSLSVENLEENYEHDLSGNNFEDSFENKNDENNIVSRHGSGDTYTKFTEDPADLEEFLNLTDKIIQNNNENYLNEADIEKSLENMHTPQTNSLESMNDQIDTTKPNFSDSLQELKNDLKDLLNGSMVQQADVIKDNCESVTDENKRNVCDLEHITVYQLKFYEQAPDTQMENISDKTSSELKLPAINDKNRLSKADSTRNKKSKSIKGNKKCKLIGQQNKSDSEYRTFIIKEKQEENSDEEPPLKLPRIDMKRFYYS